MGTDSDTRLAEGRNRYRLVQDGQPVAWAQGGERAYREIQYYAAVYSQDGPVTIERQRNGRWHEMPLPLDPSLSNKEDNPDGN